MRNLKKDYSLDLCKLHRFFSQELTLQEKKFLARASLILVITSMSYLYYTNEKKREVQVQSSWALYLPQRRFQKYTITFITHLAKWESVLREKKLAERKMSHIIIQNDFTGKNADYRKISSIIMNPDLMCVSRTQKGLESHLYFVLGMVIYMEII